jgi:hypothetical protein
MNCVNTLTEFKNLGFLWEIVGQAMQTKSNTNLHAF